MVEIIQIMMTENRCYQRGSRITPWGIVLHSTAKNNKKLSRYVQPDPDGRLGRNQYGNHWNQQKADKCMHGFLGELADGTLAFAQNLPWDYRSWGCGGDDSGSYNDSHIQFEICEDNRKNADYYWAAFNAAAEICAMLCKQYGIRTRNIVSHSEAHAALYASNHSDTEHWMSIHGDTMDAFRARVAAMIGEDNTVRPTWEEMRRDTIRRNAKSHAVAEMQGILLALGYDVGKKGADGIYGASTIKAVKKFQGDHQLTPDGVAGPATWQKALALIAAIEAADKPAEAPPEDAAPPSDPEQAEQDAWMTLSLEEKVENLHRRMITAETVLYGGDDFRLPEGGESDG